MDKQILQNPHFLQWLEKQWLEELAVLSVQETILRLFDSEEDAIQTYQEEML